jgi:predicted RNase H-like nuclease (RuvC/YqgF family)
MSEKRYKRFYVSESENQLIIYDNEGLDDYYHLGNDERDVKGICKLLNEQQSHISQLKQEIGEWKKENRELLDQIQEFERIPKSIRELWVE